MQTKKRVYVVFGTSSQWEFFTTALHQLETPANISWQMSIFIKMRVGVEMCVCVFGGGDRIFWNYNPPLQVHVVPHSPLREHSALMCSPETLWEAHFQPLSKSWLTKSETSVCSNLWTCSPETYTHTIVHTLGTTRLTAARESNKTNKGDKIL